MKNRMDIYLLIGQSNMAGRGLVVEVDAIQDSDILMFRNGQWLEAVEPLHTDKPEIAGIGLGMSFAKEIRSACGRPVGLLPCAVGGTRLERWMPGADLYEQTLTVALRALPDGVLRGILWHQGEGDSHEETLANSYAQRLETMIQGLRRDLAAEDVPVLAGELGEFLKDRAGLDFFPTVNLALMELENRLPFYRCVSAEGLADNGDHLHFNAAALREFGLRYAAAFLATSVWGASQNARKVSSGVSAGTSHPGLSI